MYPVSNDYLTAIERGSVTTYWYGTVKTKNGETYSIDEETIAQGSGRITRELVSGIILISVLPAPQDWIYRFILT